MLKYGEKMSRKDKGPKQTSVKISKGLVEAIDKFLETELAWEMGFHSRADIIAVAVREFLAKHGYYRPQGGEEGERRE